MKRSGFTMIELMITTLVMVLLTLAAYPTLNSAERKQELITNTAVLEECFVQGVALAKAPTQTGTTKVHIRFSQQPAGCRLTEEAGGVETETKSYTPASAEKYRVTLVPAVDELVISTLPPYPFTKPSQAEAASAIIQLNSLADNTVVSTTTVNLVTGTIIKRSR